MLAYPNIDPVAIAIGPLKVHWYGLMYLVGFAAAWLLGRYRIRTLHTDWEVEQLSDLIFYCAMGAVLGGRVGYMLFYQSATLMENPLALFKIWQGGMSFHGGLIGLTVAVWLFGRKVNKPLFQVVDFVAPLAPLGLGFGRIGNFINGELWGRVTTVEWGMVFPGGGPLPRHPSSLYQAFLEGIVLFALVWWFSSKKRPAGSVSGVFLIGYGFARIAVEFVRQPDDHLGFIAFDWLTMGQMLSLPMVLGGAALVWFAFRRERE